MAGEQSESPSRAARDAAANEQVLAEQAAVTATEAKHAAEVADLRARQAAEALGTQRERLRAERLASKRDSVPCGTVNLIPELGLSDQDLVDRVNAGKVDGVLTELLGMCKAHPRLKPEGTFSERQLPISAIQKRLAR